VEKTLHLIGIRMENYLILQTKKFPPLNREEFRNLLFRYRNNNDKVAYDKIVKSNLRYVFSQAIKYAHGNEDLRDDLMSEGIIGLMRAIDKFDISYDVEFMTYASFHIKRFILTYLYTKNRQIRLPIRYETEITKYSKLGLLDDLASERWDIRYCLNLMSINSLNATVSDGESEGHSLEDFVEDHKASTEDDWIKNLDKDVIRNEIKKLLSPRDFNIIMKRAEGATLQAIMAEYGGTAESIRQHIISIKRKLRKSPLLKYYYSDDPYKEEIDDSIRAENSELMERLFNACMYGDLPLHKVLSKMEVDLNDTEIKFLSNRIKTEKRKLKNNT
jgi:RNA polymerase sigma factor (sigma-70 family)